MSNHLSNVLEEFKAQRRHRQAKRNEYLRRFQVLRQTFSHIQHHHSNEVLPNSVEKTHNLIHKAHHQTQQEVRQVTQRNTHFHQAPIIVQSHHAQSQHQHHSHHQNGQPTISRQNEIQKKRYVEQQEKLLEQQELLRQDLLAIQSQEKEKLFNFRGEIEAVRNKYIEEVQKLTEKGKKSKEQIQAKAIKIEEQSSMAIAKNSEIQSTNASLKTQVQEGKVLMQQYEGQIQKQYAEKITQFQKIFISSNEKIQAMESTFNEDQFIENTLKNEELLKSIEQNAAKAQQAGQILEDYGVLLEGKKQILFQINSNNEMKQKQIEKMIELQSKMKLIMDKLTSQKKIYVTENNKMAAELLQIKNLLMGVMNEQKS